MSISFSIAKIAPWVLRIIAALIMLQTLYFKFSGAEESVYIFSQLGMEPWGRIGTGILELIASILILYPRTTFFGSVLAIGLMSGAIVAHLTKLGITVKNDNPVFTFVADVISRSLQGVNIVSSRPLIRQEDDKTIVVS